MSRLCMIANHSLKEIRIRLFPFPRSAWSHKKRFSLRERIWKQCPSLFIRHSHRWAYFLSNPPVWSWTLYRKHAHPHELNGTNTQAWSEKFLQKEMFSRKVHKFFNTQLSFNSDTKRVVRYSTLEEKATFSKFSSNLWDNQTTVIISSCG